MPIEILPQVAPTVKYCQRCRDQGELGEIEPWEDFFIILDETKQFNMCRWHFRKLAREVENL